MRALPLLMGALAATACTSPEDTAQLEVYAGDRWGRTHPYTVEWPVGSGERVPVNTSLTDSAGLAGLVVEVFIPGEPMQMLEVHDFSGTNQSSPPIELPVEGTVSVFATLHQNGEPVAQGDISWPLQPHRGRWFLSVYRTPNATGASVDASGQRAACGVPHCHSARRYEIREGARNHPDEALWLVLWEG